MKTNDYYRTYYIKELGLTISKVKKIRNVVDDAYYSLCTLGLYGDAYNTLQKIHGILDDLMDDEHLDEDDFGDLQGFIANYCYDF